MANLEAIWVSGLIHPAECIAASDQAHYTHERISGVLGVPFTKIKSDHKGRMDMKDLKHQLDERSIGTVVVTMGTTGLGAVDPLKDILALQEAYSFRIHVDAAYGGYYLLCESLSDESLSHFQLIGQADSVVIDPHKHGLQPYGCGCVIFRDQSVGTHYLHDSPYTYFSSSDLHLGEISLECSRPGASAVALWATHRLLPLTRSGEFASNLNKSRMAALRLVELIEQSNEFELVCPPELDIVVWYFNAKSTRIMSTLANNLFKLAAKKGLHLALYNYPVEKMNLTDTLVDTPYVTCLRSCLMKEDHLEWIDRIWHIIEDCRDELLSS
jgi:glutamate/tyrosine decarboxylase-like PLP-dependent enzyme